MLIHGREQGFGALLRPAASAPGVCPPEADTDIIMLALIRMLILFYTILHCIILGQTRFDYTITHTNTILHYYYY